MNAFKLGKLAPMIPTANISQNFPSKLVSHNSPFLFLYNNPYSNSIPQISLPSFSLPSKHGLRVSSEGFNSPTEPTIEDSKFVPLNPEDPRYGPPALLLLGFELEEGHKIRQLLKEMEGEFLQIIYCTEDMISGSLWNAMSTSKQDLGNAKLAKLKGRICILSGLSGEEMMMFIEAFQESGIESAVFAALVPNSADKSLAELIEEIMADHELTTAKQSNSQAIRHVLVNAATGTGKTIAYLAPIIHHLQKYDPRIQRADGTFALVLVPTRELCMQVYEILQKLLHRFHWIVPGYIMGGENRSKEKARLRKGISILVATPGRLLDHLKNTSSFVFTNLHWLIFDEADRILELGFGKDIEEILDALGSRKSKSIDQQSEIASVLDFKRQNLLLSATLNEKVNHLAKMSLKDPVMIGVAERKLRQFSSSGHLEFKDDGEVEDSGQHLGSVAEDYNLPSQLVQRYVKVPCGSRLAVLLSVLKNLFGRESTQKVVVFFSTCDAVDFHYSLIKEFLWPPSSSDTNTELRQLFLGCRTFRLHGNMEHDERRTTFQTFKTEKSAVLLSTDVSARGLDFPKVRCIIQYDSPGEATEYVHRVGRTARLGQKGDSLLFLQPIEVDYLQDLEKHGVSLMEYPLQKVLDGFALSAPKYHAKKFVSIEMHPWVVGLQRALEAFILTQANLKNMAKAAFITWVRAYAAHRGDLKRIFMVKKLHLGHVAKSFALKEQPSLVGKALHKQEKKRKKFGQKQKGQSKKRKVTFEKT